MNTPSEPNTGLGSQAAQAELDAIEKEVNELNGNEMLEWIDETQKNTKSFKRVGRRRRR